MVILAASILNKSGKILFSRQYVDNIPRYRIEEYVREFMHMMTTGQDQTYFEGGNVSYVYKPIESLYLLIVTDKQANIIAKKDTLVLLSRLVSNKCSSLDEKGICDSAFELVFAFDEVINPGGTTDNVNFEQVLTNLDMCSVNETAHILETQKKVDKTKEVMKQKAKEIDRKKEASWELAKDMCQGEPELFGFFRYVRQVSRTKLLLKGEDCDTPTRSCEGTTHDRDTKRRISETICMTKRGSQVLQSKDSIANDASTTATEGLILIDWPRGFGKSRRALLPPKPVKGSASGLRLHSDKGKEVTKYLEAVKAEGGYVEEEQSRYHQSEPTALLPTDSVLFTVEEHIDVTRRLSANIIEFGLQGTLSLQIPVHLGLLSEVKVDFENGPELFFNPVPRIHRGLFTAQKTLLLGDLFSKSHVLPDSGVCLLDWKIENVDKSLLPLLVDCLTTPTALYIHYEASPMSNLRNVMITVLIPNLSEKSSIENSPGISRYDRKESAVKWSIPLIQESNKSTGTLEIQDPSQDPLPFPPISVDFRTEHTLSKLKVMNIVPKKSEDPTTFSQYSQLSTRKYMVYP